MPLVNILSLPPSDPRVIEPLLAEIRDRGALAFHCAPENIWVTFQALPSGHYVQGDSRAEHPDGQTHPPLVILRAQTGRSAAQRDGLVRAIGDALARAFQIPAAQVWIHYQEMNPADVWFQGSWAG
jgi:phenylpyruvate tautomerase PptA (4-oxalocrotonate tautomerase family)